jgi:hypothetical protein
MIAAVDEHLGQGGIVELDQPAITGAPDKTSGVIASGSLLTKRQPGLGS